MLSPSGLVMSIGASVWRWALTFGALGFLAGFVGPMLFAPDANQGPMLGLFITGPLGFGAGAVFGLVRGVVGRR